MAHRIGVDFNKDMFALSKYTMDIEQAYDEIDAWCGDNPMWQNDPECFLAVQQEQKKIDRLNELCTQIQLAWPGEFDPEEVVELPPCGYPGSRPTVEEDPIPF